ncbi:aldehyde ferredoxin oxidoreductase family protein [Chloroflexota bacterium]
MKGYAGSILYVNLTTGEIRKELLDLKVARSFIGGLGVNVKLGYDLIKPGIGSLSPANQIIIGAGPFVGTNVPGSCRVCSVTKLPVSGAIGWASGGGMNFGCMLKHAGYDHIVIEGRADKPVYLKIFDDDVEICDAGALWGKGSGEAVDELYSKYARPLGVISIGQGGENQVKFALTFIEKVSTLGRGGLGAVFGSKNLKAIITKGTKGIGVSDRKRYRALVEQLYERMKKYPSLKDAQKYGFLNFMPAIPREDYLQLKKARLACVSCPIADKELLQIKKGKLRGFTKYTTAAVNVIIPLIYGITRDYGECIKLTDIVDEYGIDMFETFELLKFADELYKHGMLTEDELGAPGVRFDYDSLPEWFRKIAYREGFGNVLADGFKDVLQKYGKGIEEFAPCEVKGTIAYEGITGPIFSDLFTTFEFGMVVHPRGPASAPGGSSPLYFTRGRPADWIKGHLDRMGALPDAIDRMFVPKEGMAVNVGRMEKYAQQFLFTCDSLGTCGRGQINRFNSSKLQAELYSAVTGFETSQEELIKASERVFNLLKAANVREGFDRKDDRFPERWFGDKKHKDYYEKVEITKEMAYGLLDDYYDERGWDVKTGIPTKSKLLELGLDYVIKDAEKMGIKYI